MINSEFQIFFTFDDTYEYKLRIEKINSDYFLIKSNILYNERSNINLNKEISEISEIIYNNIYEILNFSYEIINFRNIILRKRFKKAYIKELQAMR
jgi:hypothetical protein